MGAWQEALGEGECLEVGHQTWLLPLQLLHYPVLSTQENREGGGQSEGEEEEGREEQMDLTQELQCV